MPAKDLTGQKFGYLTVIRREGTTTVGTQRATWLCQCDCGNEVVRVSQSLRLTTRPNGNHCGCRWGVWNKTHGLSTSRPYNTWAGMKLRCTDPKNKDWPNYGARGITVCPQWLESFEAFWADMQHGYEAHLTLGREDNDGPYNAQNCRWETSLQQGNNKRTSRIIETPAGAMTVANAAMFYGLKRITLYRRLDAGWSVERAIVPPSLTLSTAALAGASLRKDRRAKPS